MEYDEWVKRGRPHWQCKSCLGIMVTIPIEDDFICPSCKLNPPTSTRPRDPDDLLLPPISFEDLEKQFQAIITAEEINRAIDSQVRKETIDRVPSPLGLPTGWRGYEPGLFQRAYEACKGDIECESEVRRAYRIFESKRWWDAMDRMHNFLVHLDPDEEEDFKRRFPGIVEVVNEFATIEQFRKV